GGWRRETAPASPRAPIRDARSGSGRTCRRAARARASRGRLLEPRSRLREKRQLFGRRRAPEHGIAMRIAAEAANDLCMLFGPFELVGERCFAFEPRVELDRTLLGGDILGVLERQVEEQALIGAKRRVAAGVDDR